MRLRSCFRHYIPFVSAVLLCCSGDDSIAQSSFSMDSQRVKQIAISSDGLTRISVEGDSIIDMFAYPGDLPNSLNLHESGHLFIAPAGLDEPIYITVMTRDGHTQDLKLNFVTKRPEPILLIPKAEITVSESQLHKWLTVALLREVPRGFKRESISQDKRLNRRLTKQTVAHECDRYSNGHYEISVFEITANQRMPLTSNLSVSSHKGGSDAKYPLSFGLSTDMYLSDEEAGLLSTSIYEESRPAPLLAIIKKKES